MKDIFIRPKAIKDLKFPFTLVVGKIGKIEINIPWKNNFSTPTIINIHGVKIVLNITKSSDWELLDYLSFDSKINFLNKFSKQKLDELSNAFEKDKPNTYVDRISLKVLDNLQINISNIHIRIEDNNMTPPISLGLTLQSFNVTNTDENWNPVFVDRNLNKNALIFKLLKLNNFGFFLNINDKLKLGEFQKAKDVEIKMGQMFSEKCEYVKDYEYLIKPISLISKMTQIPPDQSVALKYEEARTNLSIDLTNFNIRLKKLQFNAIIKILNKINKYQKFQNQFYETRRYKFFRPGVFASKTDHFRYGILMVIKRIRYNHGNFKSFEIPESKMKIFEESFLKLFPVYLNSFSLEELPSEKQSILKRIVEVVDIDILYQWAVKALRVFFIASKKEQNRKEKVGAVWRFLGYNIAEDQLLTKDEEDKIKEILDNSLFYAFDPNQNESSIVSRLKQQNKNELKFKVFFSLKDGSFEFLKNIGNEVIENYDCFSLSYKNLGFVIKNSEKFSEYECTLKEIYLQMFSLENGKKMKIIRLSYLNNNEILTNNPDWNQTVARRRKSSILSKIEENFVWKITFKQYSQDSDVNSDLKIELSTLDVLCHQLFLERVISFFNVKIEEDLAVKAWDKWAEIKTNTQKTISDVINKKNIVTLNIEPRRFIIPLNRYDTHNSKWLQLEMGNIGLKNVKYLQGAYEERNDIIIDAFSLNFFENLKDLQNNDNPFKMIYDTQFKLGIAILPIDQQPTENPSVKLIVDIQRIKVQMTEYIYALMLSLGQVLTPSEDKEDTYTQKKVQNSEIKKNLIVHGNLLKKNTRFLNWEEYFGCLSGGYIYFYKSSQDEEYSDYFYIKDSKIEMPEDKPMEIILRNSFGTLDLKFPKEDKKEKWVKKLQEKINEMKIYYDSINKSSYENSEQSKKIDNNVINFGIELNIANANFDIIEEESNLGNIENEKFNKERKIVKKKSLIKKFKEIIQPKKLFSFTISNFILELITKHLTNNVKLSIDNIKLVDNYPDNPSFGVLAKNSKVFKNGQKKRISVDNVVDNLLGKASATIEKLKMESNESKFLQMEITLEDENSPEYKNILIDISIIVGFLDIYWQPIIIRKLLAFFAHNDIVKDKVEKDIGLLSEILNPNQTGKKGEQATEPAKKQNSALLTCSEFKYIYIRVGTMLKEINIILIQPILNLNLYELNIKKGNLIAEMYVDHFKIFGSLDAFEIQELSNYPYTIKTQAEFHSGLKKHMLSTKNKNSLAFDFVNKNMHCRLYDKNENVTSETNLTIKNVTLHFYQESFLRFFNYLISEFLGSLGPPQKIVDYRKSKEKLWFLTRKKTAVGAFAPKSLEFAAEDSSLKLKAKSEFNSQKLNFFNIYKKIQSDEFNKSVEFMKLNVVIENPNLVLKARPTFTEYFKITLKKLVITCAYYKKTGLIRALPNLFRFVSVYKLAIEDFSIKSHDNFYICEPTNTLVNMHFSMLSEADMKNSDLNVDKSMRFDVLLNPIKIRLRQADFKNIMMLNDLNLAYSDGQTEEYDYAKFYKELSEKLNNNYNKQLELEIKNNFHDAKIPMEMEKFKEIKIGKKFKGILDLNKGKIKDNKANVVLGDDENDENESELLEENVFTKKENGFLYKNLMKQNKFFKHKLSNNNFNYNSNNNFNNNNNNMFLIHEKNTESEKDHYTEANEEPEIHFKHYAAEAANLGRIKYEENIENIDKIENSDLINFENNEINENKNFNFSENEDNEMEEADNISIFSEKEKSELLERFYDMNLNLLIDKIEIKLICHDTNNNMLNNFAGLVLDRLFLKYNRKLNKNQYMNLFLNEISVVEQNLNYGFESNYYFNKYKSNEADETYLVFNNQLKNDKNIEEFLNKEFKSLTYENVIRSNCTLGFSNGYLGNSAAKQHLSRSFDEIEDVKDFNEIANEIIENIEINYNAHLYKQNKKKAYDKFNNKLNSYFIDYQTGENVNNNSKNNYLNANSKSEIDKSGRNSVYVKSERDAAQDAKSNKISALNVNINKNNNNYFIKNKTYTNVNNNTHKQIIVEQENILQFKKQIVKEYEKLKKNLLLLKEDVYSTETFQNAEVYLSMKINAEREKNYDIFLNNLKVLVKLDTFLLIKQFFLEGFPFYSTKDKDLPLLYEENEENNPGMFLKLFIKNPKLCLLTDAVHNSEQDLICLTSDIEIIMKTEKIFGIKKKIYESYLSNIKNKDNFIRESKSNNSINSQAIELKYISDKNDINLININNKNENEKNEEAAAAPNVYSENIYELTVNCHKLCPFVIKFSDFMNPLNSEIEKNRRKIIEDFDLIYASNSLLKLSESKTLFNLSSHSEITFNDSDFVLKASYRDIVLFLKAYEFNSNFTGKEYEEKLNFMKSYSNSKLKKDSKTELKKRKINNIINGEDFVKKLQGYIREQKDQALSVNEAFDENSENENNLNTKKANFKSVYLKNFYEKNNEIFEKFRTGKTIRERTESIENYDSDQDENKDIKKDANNKSVDSNDDFELENNHLDQKYHENKISNLLDEEKSSRNISKNNLQVLMKSNNNSNFSNAAANFNNVNNYNENFTVSYINENLNADSTENNQPNTHNNSKFATQMRKSKTEFEPQAAALFEQKFNSKNSGSSKSANFNNNNSNNGNNIENKLIDIELKKFNTEDIQKLKSDQNRKSKLKRKMSLLDIYNDKKFKSSVMQKKNLLNRKTLIGAFNEFNLTANKSEFIKIVKDANILEAFADEIVDKNDILKEDDFDDFNEKYNESFKNNNNNNSCIFEKSFYKKNQEEEKIKNIEDVEIDKIIIVNNNEFYTLMNFKKIEIMFIDDHADHYYPFFYMKFKNLKIENIALLNKSDYTISSKMKFKTFNYIANLWEPLLEKTYLFLQYSYLKQVKDDENREKAEIILSFMNGQNKAKVDLNISDLTISFLYKMTNSWYAKYEKLSKNYKEEVKNLIKKNKEPTKISNHVIYNCTGRFLKLLKVDKIRSKSDISSLGGLSKELVIETIANGKTYEIDYFQKLKKQENKNIKNFYEEKSIKIGFADEAEIHKDLLKLDLVSSKIHLVDYSKILLQNEKKNMLRAEENLNFYFDYSYIFSNVTIEKLRRHIYLYAPLTFTNKFNKRILILIQARNMSNYLAFAEPEETIGIPYEYYDGEIKFELNGTFSKSFLIYDLLNTNTKANFNWFTWSNYNKTIEIKFEKEFLCMFVNENFINNKFINTVNSENVDSKILKTMKNYIISYPYCIRNLMPFDIKVKIKTNNNNFIGSQNNFENTNNTKNKKQNQLMIPTLKRNSKENNLNNITIKKVNEDLIPLEIQRINENEIAEKPENQNVNSEATEKTEASLAEGEFIIKKSEQIFLTEISSLQNLEAEIEFLDFKSKGALKLFILENTFKNPKEKFKNNHSLKIFDPKETAVEILSTFSDDSSRTIFIHSAGVLINETGLEQLNFHYTLFKKEKEINLLHKRSEKSNIFLVDPNQKLVIEFQGLKSKPINLKVIGIDNVLELTNNEGNLLEVVFVSKLSLLSQELNYYANIYTLYPKFIFYNNLNFDLCVNLVENANSKEKEAFVTGASPKKAYLPENLIAKRTSLLSTVGLPFKQVLKVKVKIPFYFFNKGSKNFVCFMPLNLARNSSCNKDYIDNMDNNNNDYNVIYEENFMHENNFVSNSNVNNVDENNGNYIDINSKNNAYAIENEVKEPNKKSINNPAFNYNHEEKANEFNSPDLFMKKLSKAKPEEENLNFSPKKKNYLDTEENNLNNLNNCNSINNNKFNLRNSYNKNDYNNIDWDWSFPVDLNNDKILTIQIFSADKKKRKLINLEKKIEKYTTFVKLTEVTEDTCQIKIENYSKVFGFRLQQNKYDEYSVKVNPITSELFSFIDLQKRKIIDMKIFKKNKKFKLDSIGNNAESRLSINNINNNNNNNLNNNNTFSKDKEIFNIISSSGDKSRNNNIIEILSFELLENKIAELTTELYPNFVPGGSNPRSSFMRDNSQLRISTKTEPLKTSYSNATVANVYTDKAGKYCEYPYEKIIHFENIETEEEFILEIKIETDGFRKIIKIKDFNPAENSENVNTNYTKLTEETTKLRKSDVFKNLDLKEKEINNFNYNHNNNNIENNSFADSPIKKLNSNLIEKQEKDLDSENEIQFKLTKKQLEAQKKEEDALAPKEKTDLNLKESDSQPKSKTIKSTLYSISIPYLGISVIGDNKNINYSKAKYERTELFYFSFKGIEINYNSSEEKFEEYKLIIEDIKMDNQFSDYAIFPNILVSTANFEQAAKRKVASKHKLNAGSTLLVVEEKDKKIAAEKPNAILRFGKEEKEELNFNNKNKENKEKKNLVKLEICIESEKNKNKKIKHIKHIEYDLSSFYLNIDTSVINKLLEFSDNLTIELETSVVPVEQIFLKEETETQDKFLIRKSKYLQSGKILLQNEHLRNSHNTLNTNAFGAYGAKNPFSNPCGKNASESNFNLHNQLSHKIDIAYTLNNNNNNFNRISSNNNNNDDLTEIRKQFVNNNNSNNNNNFNVRNSTNTVKTFATYTTNQNAFNNNNPYNNNIYKKSKSSKHTNNIHNNNKNTNTETVESSSLRFIKDDFIQPFWEKPLSFEKGEVTEKYIIEKLLMSKIEINLSFLSQGNAKEVFKRLLSANPIVTSVLSSLTNLENVKILLKGAELLNVYGDTAEISQNIIFNYKQSAVSQIMKLLGSIEIFGNPVNLMSNLGTGFRDFIEKPVEGLKKNVVQGALGVAEGSLSLVKHTVKGTFSTTGKITSGISKGFLYITQDDEYIKKQQIRKIRHKPKNFVEGLGYGLSSMAGGIYNGFKDVIMKPIEGAKKQRWKGLGKGVLKGFAGVIIKPISGVLDLVSQTSEGIKNTLTRELDDNRERWPRMFYGKFKFIKDYNSDYALLAYIVKNRIDKLKIAESSLDIHNIDVFRNKRKEPILIVFLHQSFLLIDLLRNEIKKIICYRDIKDIILYEEHIKIDFVTTICNKKLTKISFYTGVPRERDIIPRNIFYEIIEARNAYNTFDE